LRQSRYSEFLRSILRRCSSKRDPFFWNGTQSDDVYRCCNHYDRVSEVKKNGRRFRKIQDHFHLVRDRPADHPKLNTLEFFPHDGKAGIQEFPVHSQAMNLGPVSLVSIKNDFVYLINITPHQSMSSADVKISALFAVLFICKCSQAQIDSSDYKDHCLYLYRSESDYFNKIGSYRGQYIPSDDVKILKYETAAGKKRALDLGDSCSHYFAYQIGDEIQVRPSGESHDFNYYSFGGGNSLQYCVVYGKLPNYDKNGFLAGITSPAGRYFIYFVDRVNKLNMVQLDKFLESKPQLLRQFKVERDKMDLQQWERNKLAISIKYLKRSIALGKTNSGI
jgi:hypothetical protein